MSSLGLFIYGHNLQIIDKQRIVPPEGLLTAKVLFVGEAPGPQEILAMRPFIGPSGHIVRSTLTWAGINVEREVRFTNVVRYNPGMFPSTSKGYELLDEFSALLDTEINAMPNLKVIVACGGPAMTRLTGRRSRKGTGWGIERYRGFVFHAQDIPDILTWGSYKHYTKLPEGVVVIPVLHPAGIMRSKGRDDITLFRRDVMKVARAARGELQRPSYLEHFAPTPDQLAQAVNGATRVFFDTEFHAESKQVTWCGLTVDGINVYGFPWHYDYAKTLKDLWENENVVKGAHNISADLDALRASGFTTAPAGDIYDTMIGMHTLHPALEVGLDDTARFYLDDIQQWKDMESDDPHYNALDVVYGWHAWDGQLAEAKSRPVDPVPELKSRMKLVQVAISMEVDGMDVEAQVQAGLETEARDKVAKLEVGITDKVKLMWDGRVRREMEKAAHAKVVQKAIEFAAPHPCPQHPSANGLRLPEERCQDCVAFYMSIPDERKVWEDAKKARTKSNANVKRWEKGFSPTNSHHLQWLLYDPLALRLPLQHATGAKTRKPSSGRYAIDKLAALAIVRSQPEKFELVTQIKEVQHLEKAISTFITIPVDNVGVAHPKYKVHGTRTGRLAGGKDDDERSDNTYAFNALNIPREWRGMYVAPPGCILIAADWCLAKGTQVSTPSGHTAIEDLKIGDLVFSCDPSTGKPCCEKVTHVMRKGVRQTSTVTFDDQSTVDATPDHQFIRRDGSEVRTDELKINDSLLSVRRCIHPDGHVHMYSHTAFKYTKEHLAVFDAAFGKAAREDKVVHHIDENPQNNKPSNLQAMTAADHTRLHLVGKHNQVHTDSMLKRWAAGEFANRNYTGEKNPNWKGGKKARACELCTKPFAVKYRRSPKKFCSNSCSSRHRWSSSRAKLNHKVVSIVQGPEVETYDISVTGTHTFVLANGVVSHNCNVEGRLTAHFSKDPAYSTALDAEFKGGHKVHAINAGIIYSIDPADAQTHKVMLSGQERTAYDGGKRLTHAWSYGMKPPHMSRTYNISLTEAKRIDDRLSDAYGVLVRWRQKLVDDVLGVWEPVPGSKSKKCVQEGRRFIANPYGWQLHFLGINAEQANEVIAFLPQSTGQSIWSRCAPQLRQRYRIFTGTYDSFVLVASLDDAGECATYLQQVMEQSWPELGGKSFPCEIATGYNWGSHSTSNPRGLKKVA